MTIRAFLRDLYPQRSIRLTTASHSLIFEHGSPRAQGLKASSSQTDINRGNGLEVRFIEADAVDLSEYSAKPLNQLPIWGTLGLVTLHDDIFLCVVSSAHKVATVRANETVQRIGAVEFYCLTSNQYDSLLYNEINPYSTDGIAEDGFEQGYSRPDGILEHPCMALKKLLSGGSFYYSSDFDLTTRLQNRQNDQSTVRRDSLDAGFLWNSYLIQPLIDFRSRLTPLEQDALDECGFLTSAIRGFAHTITIPASSSPLRSERAGLPSTLTLISRLSCRRAGTRFNARGIDDDGNVANFVETEVIFSTPTSLCFSYVQLRGSVPVFWEQATGLLPSQQKITLTRSAEATQPAFDKHFEALEHNYGSVHIVNLLSNHKPGETDLSKRYGQQVSRSSLNNRKDGSLSADHNLLKLTDYDFHAETRAEGYEAAKMIMDYIGPSAESFAYYLSEEAEEFNNQTKTHAAASKRSMVILQQEGVFRTNCLDCLDRTNLVQTIISEAALSFFLQHRGERGTSDFLARHNTLWADNGDALSHIYAGTGALKSSYTRSGKMSFAGAIADIRKSATRMYVNNFADKGRQNTIDMLLGRLIGQAPVHLMDPVRDYVLNELAKRTVEFSKSEAINIYVGTLNLNGRTNGLSEDLSPWLLPSLPQSQARPDVVAVGFQEIVELSPQQIMSTDPRRRQAWEHAVLSTLNERGIDPKDDYYVLVRSGQLVGCALSVFARASRLPRIKNVEGSLKKTGMSGMAGNKGAVAIRLEYAHTSLCFVTAHLAAGFANYEERNRDYQTINQGLRFQRNRAINDHDSVIWFGDFNYRIGLSNERVRALVKVGDWGDLYDNDQLNIQMMAGNTFGFYSEGKLTFQPTYKYDIGTDQYDSSEKQRIPAWCDRVLWKGDNLHQINYTTAPLKFSDHRPVYATFQCKVTVVDEVVKERISKELFAKRRGILERTDKGVDSSDEEDLIGYEPVEPGLPPASSDRQKWWLANGTPARSTVLAPSKEAILNPGRPSNPFKQSSEPDWILKLANPSQVSTSNHEPHQHTQAITSVQEPDGDVHRFSSTSSNTPKMDRKPAPPIPKKPNSLSSSLHTENSTGQGLVRIPSEALGTSGSVRAQLKQPSGVRPSQMPLPPPPRRSGYSPSISQSSVAPQRTMSKQPARRSLNIMDEDVPPTLPPRRGTGLMRASTKLQDEGWKPLKPQNHQHQREDS